MANFIGTCYCIERSESIDEGGFFYSHDLDGWVLDDAPRRSMSTQGRFLASIRGISDHTMEPYLWSTCPWCGGDLETPDPKY